jgi:hypothetical protein
LESLGQQGTSAWDHMGPFPLHSREQGVMLGPCMHDREHECRGRTPQSHINPTSYLLLSSPSNCGHCTLSIAPIHRCFSFFMFHSAPHHLLPFFLPPFLSLCSLILPGMGDVRAAFHFIVNNTMMRLYTRATMDVNLSLYIHTLHTSYMFIVYHRYLAGSPAISCPLPN